MYAEFTAAFQSAKTLFDLVRATQGLSNSNEVLTAVNDAQLKLSSAIASALASQEKQAALAEQVHNLQAQLRDIEDWEKQMQRYQLIEFPDTKTLAYKLKADRANGEPIHYLCITCADKKKKTTLQPIDRNRQLFCPESRTHSIHREAEPPLTIPNSVSW